MNIKDLEFPEAEEINARPVSELPFEPTLPPPVIVTAVTVQFTDPNHTHNGQPAGGQPVSLAPELAEACLKQRIATLIEE
jgi:hypothetical protein